MSSQMMISMQCSPFLIWVLISGSNITFFCYIFNGVASLCRFWPDFAFAVIDDLDMCRQEIKEYLLRYIRENCEGEEPEPDSRG